MKKTHTIEIENILIHTNHGCLDEEARIGSDYLVDVAIWADMSRSTQTDKLEDTIDYVTINQIIHQEMKVRAKLLETVVQRIINRIKTEFPMLKKVRIKLSKLNPPMGGHVEKVSVVFEEAFSG